MAFALALEFIMPPLMLFILDSSGSSNANSEVASLDALPNGEARKVTGDW